MKLLHTENVALKEQVKYYKKSKNSGELMGIN